MAVAQVDGRGLVPPTKESLAAPLANDAVLLQQTRNPADVSIDATPRGEEPGFLPGLLRDISELCGRETLRQGERCFREMIDALPAAIYTTDAEGRVTHFNPACVALSGRQPQ